MAAVMRQGIVVPGPGMPPRQLALVPPVEPVEEIAPGTMTGTGTVGFARYPSFQPGYRLVDGSDLIALAEMASLLSEGSILNFGGVGDGVTDNTHALLNALRASNVVTFPPGNFYFASQINWTLNNLGPHNPSAITIVGSGSDTTFIECAGNGWFFTMPTPANSVSIKGLTFLTNQNGIATALQFNMTSGTPLGSPALGTSDLEDLLFYGTNGYYTQYWGTAINIINASNFNFSNMSIFGGTTNAGIGVVLAGASTAYSIVFNFVNCCFNQLATGLSYGDYVQGVAIVNGNFVCQTGILIVNGTGTEQLSVTNSQFGMLAANSIGIYAPSNTNVLSDIIINGNMFVLGGANTLGIVLGAALAVNVVGNSFNIIAATAMAVTIGPGTPRLGNIAGNVFHGVGTGIEITSPSLITLGANFFDPQLATAVVGAGASDAHMTVQVLEGGVLVNRAVIMGVADSGGAGFRSLVIFN